MILFGGNIDVSKRMYIIDNDRLKMKKNQPEALQYWQNGLDTFERLKVQYRMGKQGIDWYQEQCEKMRQSIQQVKLDDRP